MGATLPGQPGKVRRTGRPHGLGRSSPKRGLMSTAPPDLSSLRIPRDEPTAPPRGGRRGWLVAAAAVAVLAVAVFALRSRPAQVEATTVAATGGDAAGDGITANGYVVARTKASVAAKVAGQLEYLGVSEGSRLRRGEVLARIESGDQQAALAQARAALAQAQASLEQGRRDLERARRLAAEQVLSAADLENAKTRVDVLAAQSGQARAQVQLAEVGLENTRVRAPFDGTVLRKDAEVGEIVAPASAGGSLTRTSIVTMADLATLEVEVDVNEAYIARIRNGQGAAITLDAYPDTSFAGRVRQVVPTADRQKATVLVKVSILDRDPRILPEMGARVVFRPQAGPAGAAPRRVLVSEGAVVRAGGATRVWVIGNDRVVLRPVTLGAARGGDVEVREGLSGGERVVLRPPAGLKPGARVRVKAS
jgi:HlyD family secretion protein